MFRCVNSALPTDPVDLTDVKEAITIAVGPIPPEQFIDYAREHECLDPLLDKLGYSDLAINSDLTGADLMINDSASYCWISRYQGVPALIFTHCEIPHIFISENSLTFGKPDAELRQKSIAILEVDFMENYYNPDFEFDIKDLKVCFTNFIKANGDLIQTLRIPLQLLVPDNFQNSIEFARTFDNKLLPDSDGIFTKYDEAAKFHVTMNFSMS
jgi:hypothetical protein